MSSSNYSNASYYLDKTNIINNDRLEFLIQKYNISLSELAFFSENNKSIAIYTSKKSWKYNHRHTSKLHYNYYEQIRYKLFLWKNGIKIIPLSFLLGLFSVYYIVLKMSVSRTNDIKTKNEKKSLLRKIKSDFENPKNLYNIQRVTPYINILEKMLKNTNTSK